MFTRLDVDGFNSFEGGAGGCCSSTSRSRAGASRSSARVGFLPFAASKQTFVKRWLCRAS